MGCCRRPVAACTIAALVVALGRPAWAGSERGAGDGHQAEATCQLDGATWTEVDARRRATELRAALIGEARSGRNWRWAWTGINAGLVALSFGPMPFVSRSQWPELVTGGVGSSLSTIVTVAWPLDVEWLAVAPPGATACEDLLVLRERALAAARDQADRRRWPWHLLNVGVGVAYFAILGLGFEHWENGVWAGVTAVAIGEAQTLTQPTGATRFGASFTW